MVKRKGSLHLRNPSFNLKTFRWMASNRLVKRIFLKGLGHYGSIRRVPGLSWGVLIFELYIWFWVMTMSKINLPNFMLKAVAKGDKFLFICVRALLLQKSEIPFKRMSAIKATENEGRALEVYDDILKNFKLFDESLSDYLRMNPFTVVQILLRTLAIGREKSLIHLNKSIKERKHCANVTLMGNFGFTGTKLRILIKQRNLRLSHRKVELNRFLLNKALSKNLSEQGQGYSKPSMEQNAEDFSREKNLRSFYQIKSHYYRLCYDLHEEAESSDDLYSTSVIANALSGKNDSTRHREKDVATDVALCLVLDKFKKEISGSLSTFCRLQEVPFSLYSIEGRKSRYGSKIKRSSLCHSPYLPEFRFIVTLSDLRKFVRFHYAEDLNKPNYENIQFLNVTCDGLSADFLEVLKEITKSANEQIELKYINRTNPSIVIPQSFQTLLSVLSEHTSNINQSRSTIEASFQLDGKRIDSDSLSGNVLSFSQSPEKSNHDQMRKKVTNDPQIFHSSKLLISESKIPLKEDMKKEKIISSLLINSARFEKCVKHPPSFMEIDNDKIFRKSSAKNPPQPLKREKRKVKTSQSIDYSTFSALPKARTKALPESSPWAKDFNKRTNKQLRVNVSSYGSVDARQLSKDAQRSKSFVSTQVQKYEKVTCDRFLRNHPEQHLRDINRKDNPTSKTNHRFTKI